jgi:magnesium chelatase family protein
MVAHINTVAFQGIDVLDIDVQVQVASGLPAFTIVGLPDKAVGESKERVRAALNAIGLSLPAKRITINLAPADVIKEGSHFDLPIAVGLLTVMDILPAEEISNYIVLGELGLGGGIAPVAGVLPAAVAANAKGKGLICPAMKASEAAWAGGDGVLAPATLLGLINHFKGLQLLASPKAQMDSMPKEYLDIADIKGQETAKRALEIAAAGGHHMLMVGPPGSGKSMLASRLPGILPKLSAGEALEVSMIHSIAGSLGKGGLLVERPFRDPHHSASMAAMAGGGRRAKPGEISLAHKGVLFLDELPEFPRQTLEALRQPIETGKVSVARANLHVTYPADFQLVAAMNPCRCGYFGDPDQECNKAPKCAQDYQAKISGPLFDRIDIHVEVPAVKPWDLSPDNQSSEGRECSADIARRVLIARKRQLERYVAICSCGEAGLGVGASVIELGGAVNLASARAMNNDIDVPLVNSRIDGKLLDAVATPDAEGLKLLTDAANKMNLSARGYHRVLRVARTIADMEDGKQVRKHHIAEALSYRRIVPGKSI